MEKFGYAPMRESINPVVSAARDNGITRVLYDETNHSRGDTTRFKRNGGRKYRTLRSHRTGRKGR